VAAARVAAQVVAVQVAAAWAAAQEVAAACSRRRGIVASETTRVD
jgi:hypothetical protein